MNDISLKRVVIVGGGTAGWMTAAALSKHLPKSCSITLIESSSISTVGVGEATIPAIRTFNEVLGIDEADFMKKTNATFKLGIQFENWGNIGDSYHHAFGYYGFPINNVPFHHYWLKQNPDSPNSEIHQFNLPNVASDEYKFALRQFNEQAADSRYFYAFQFDAGLYAEYLKNWSTDRGVRRIDAIVENVEVDKQGYIESLTLNDGQQINGDLFVDCSGFKGLLINETLGIEFNDWSHWLPVNRAWAVTTSYQKEAKIPPFTRARALQYGWQWRIPLQNRTGDGHVFSNQFVSEDEARQILLDNIEGEPLKDPYLLKFTTGCRKKTWHKNCVAIGLSGGFLEPLESTSIYLIQSAILQLIKNFPNQKFHFSEQDEFNRRMSYRYEEARNFLILHYHATNRDDTEFWNYTRTMDIPDEVKHRIELFKNTGKVITRDSDLFVEHNWLAVLFGQNIRPTGFDARVNNVNQSEVSKLLGKMKQDIKEAVNAMPDHRETLSSYCAGDLI